MDKIEWSDELSVGVHLLDEQHKRLIEMVNRLIDAFDEYVGSAIISETLLEMIEYADDHFRDEQGLMIEYGYPDYESHRGKHDEFRKKTMAFYLAAEVGVESVPNKLLEYLKHWLVHHLLEEDMKYKRFFKDKVMM